MSKHRESPSQKHFTSRYSARSLILIAGVTAAMLAGCSAVEGTSANSEDRGFAPGAPQEEVDAVIADLDPVTLTYQSPASSPTAALAPRAHAFKEAVEERSGGQITIDVVWGQAIAGYSELHEALADGRVDMAFSLPLYDPSEYPAFNSLTNALSGLPDSPLVGDLVKNTVTSEIGWASESLLEEYEANGITPLVPMVTSGTTYSLCAQPGISAKDWEGRQVRIASTSHHAVAQAIGSTPVSMEYVEMYEALQRGTVDCTFAQLPASVDTGILEVAPNIGYMSEEASLSAHSGGGEVAGAGYQNLPLAYQQIIFDAANLEGTVAMANQFVDSNHSAISQAKEHGGEIQAFDAEVDDLIIETNQALFDEAAETGLLPENLDQLVAESVEKWEAKAAELGIEDEGSIENVDEWWTPESVDFTDFAQAYYEEVALPHRPQ